MNFWMKREIKSIPAKIINESLEIKKIEDIQLILKELPCFDDPKYKIIINEIKEKYLNDSKSILTLIRNVSHYSYFFKKKIPLYLRLLIDLNKIHPIEDKIKEIFDDYEMYEDDSLLAMLIEAKLIKTNKKRKADEYQPSFNEIEEKEKELILSDDVETLQEFVSNPNFNHNFSRENYSKGMIIKNLIQFAALNGSVQCFRFLYNNGADLKGCMKFAIAGGIEEIIEILEQSGEKATEEEIKFSIIFHHIEIFEWLCDRFPSYCCHEAFSSSVRFEFGHGMTHIPQFDPVMAFNEACSNGILELVELLIQNFEAEIDKTEGLCMAIENCQQKVVEMLHNLPGIRYCDYEQSNKMINDACERGNIEIVKMMISHQEIKLTNVFRETFPLLSACKAGNLEIVKLLVDQPGVSVNQESDYDDCSVVLFHFIMSTFHYLLHAHMDTLMLLNSSLNNPEL